MAATDPITDLDVNAEDDVLRARVPCYAQAWDTKDKTCVGCDLQARCMDAIARKSLPTLAGVLGLTVDALLALPADELAEHFPSFPPHSAEYIQRYYKDPKCGLPVVQPDGTLKPSYSGPPQVEIGGEPEAVEDIPADEVDLAEVQQDLDAIEAGEASQDEDEEEEPVKTKKVAKEKKVVKQKKTTTKAQKKTTPAAKKAKPQKKTKPAAKKTAAKKTKPAAKKVKAVKKPPTPEPSEKPPTRAFRKLGARGPKTYAKRFEKEIARSEVLQGMKKGQAVTTTYKGVEYTATLQRDGWKYGEETFPTLYAVQVSIQGGGTLYAAQAREDGTRGTGTRTMSTMSVSRFWGLKTPKKQASVATKKPTKKVAAKKKPAKKSKGKKAK